MLIKTTTAYDNQQLELHLDMTKVVKMLYGSVVAMDYFEKHLQSLEKQDNIKSAQA